MFYIVGTGPNSLMDLPLSTYPILLNNRTKYIYIEHYTSILPNEEFIESLILLNDMITQYKINKIEDKNLNDSDDIHQYFNECKFRIATRYHLENSNTLIKKYQKINISQDKNIIDRHNIVLLVAGTPLFATTHTDLIIRLKQNNIPYKIINNNGINNIMGAYGLYSYKYGRTVSVPSFERFFNLYKTNENNNGEIVYTNEVIKNNESTYKLYKNSFIIYSDENINLLRQKISLPFSLIENIYSNLKNNLHTLILCDIRMRDGSNTGLDNKNTINYASNVDISDSKSDEDNKNFNLDDIKGSIIENKKQSDIKNTLADIKKMFNVLNFKETIYKTKTDNLNSSNIDNIIKFLNNKEDIFMTGPECLHTILLLNILYCEKHNIPMKINLNTKVFIVCRYGNNTEKVFYDSIYNLLYDKNNTDKYIIKDYENIYGAPLHSIIIPAEMDEVEKENVDLII